MNSSSAFMFSRIPRVFVRASVGLLFLFFGTFFYLYGDKPIYHVLQKSHLSTMVEENRNQLDGVELLREIGSHDSHLTISSDSAASPVIGDSSDSFVTGIAPTKDPENGHQQSTMSPFEVGCPKDVNFLIKVALDQELTESVRYTKSCIQPVFSSNVDRDEVVNITEPIVKQLVELDLLDCAEIQLPKCSPVKLVVPYPHTRKTFPNLIFGIATDYHRLKASIPAFTHWLSGTKSKLIVAVNDVDKLTGGRMRELQDMFIEAGIDCHIVKPLDENFVTSQNHFGILKDMVKYSSPKTEWFVLLDDDTFFPNLQPLSDALDGLDHTTDAYVGTLSEDFASVQNWGYMAFGGAGAYLSAPLAKKLADHVLECIEEASYMEGDIILRDCVYRRSKAKLTILPGLHQQDFQGDAGGFFEAGFKPINLHHWKSWFQAPVVAMAKAADFCGDCFLQRWRFGNDTVLSNGYSIATYRDGLSTVDLSMPEGTWDKFNGDFDFSIGPLRAPYSKEQKKTFRLLDAEITPEGQLRQLYVWKGNDTAGELDEVIEMVWGK